MTRFPTAGHLVSWAKFAPASRSPPATPRAADRPGTATPTWLGCSARPPSPPARPIPSWVNATGGSPVAAARRAIVAVGRSILVIAWHLLSDPEAHFQDLGAGLYDTRIGPERAKRNHIRQLEALGYKVTLQPAA